MNVNRLQFMDTYEPCCYYVVLRSEFVRACSRVTLTADANVCVGLKYSRATLFTPSTVRVQRHREVASSAARSNAIFAALAEDPDTSRGAINTGSQLFKVWTCTPSNMTEHY
jgi:hypothetical protein